MVKNIVLVHGGLVDGSSWAKVIPLLEAQGLEVTAVQNPLTGLADDVAAATRALALQDGPALLVGHSWGGVVITEAGTHPAVAGLAYVCAFAPSPGESLVDVSARGPAAAGGRHFTADAAGFVRITRQGLDEDLGPDVVEAERRLLFATQHPLAAASQGEPVGAAAWQTKPSWYLVTENDRTLHPDLQRAMAQQIGATTRSVASGHLPIFSQPTAVAGFLIEAARQVG
ncbi:alpha/beta hydrolase [Hymenobacter sp.]|uniref:alpha/beta fold hydrolase n=1 Tax=Hymenobacter sp. TaxID=1898978 RepID=UPI00286D0647|nr:alpha/beta hydrolase [Hymenobacter sp.]